MQTISTATIHAAKYQEFRLLISNARTIVSTVPRCHQSVDGKLSPPEKSIPQTSFEVERRTKNTSIGRFNDAFGQYEYCKLQFC